MPDRYAAFTRMTGPARERASLRRLALGVAVALVVAFGLSRAFLALAAFVLSEDAYWTLSADIVAGTTPRGMLILLALMGTLGIGAVVAVEVVHRRSAATLLGPLPLALRQFLRVTVAAGLLSASVALLLPGVPWRDLEPGLEPARWLALLPLTLVALLIQTGSEEILFRGYLQTQLAARFRHPAVWLVLPAAAFGAAHHAPGVYGANAAAVALWAGVFGLAAADLTARAGTLGPAIALHFVNNLFAVAVTSMQGALSGLALMRLSFGPEDTAALRALLPLELAMIGLGWLAARVAIRA